MAVQPLTHDLPWMAWNLFLAMVPLGLAIVLFAEPRDRTRRWWFGVATFVAFLPNAPYVLTDVKHLHRALSHSYGIKVEALLIAEYAVFLVLGFGAYLASLAIVREWLREGGLPGWATPVEVALHALSAVGIYIGRVLRLNSWDVFVRPQELAGYLGVPSQRALVIVPATFLVLVAGTAVAKAAVGGSARRAL
jgi:uncharacterized membrane protein